MPITAASVVHFRRTFAMRKILEFLKSDRAFILLDYTVFLVVILLAVVVAAGMSVYSGSIGLF